MQNGGVPEQCSSVKLSAEETYPAIQ